MNTYRNSLTTVYEGTPQILQDYVGQQECCDFKSNVEIMHYDDISADIKYVIDIREFGNDKGYIADCVVIRLGNNGGPLVSYYANLNDFTNHPKWNYENCFVVCFDEHYKRDHK